MISSKYDWSLVSRAGFQVDRYCVKLLRRKMMATSSSHQHHFLLILSDPGTFEFTKPSFIIRESEGVLEVRIV